MCNICGGLRMRWPAPLMATDDAMASTAAPPTSAAATPGDALRLLRDGNARYASNTPNERDFSAGRASRALGQAPFAAILGCADSRVAPELAFDQGPGDLFVVRIAGNFVTDEGVASLEFGTAVLGVKLILVLGHTSCGAVNATIGAIREGNTLPGHLAELVETMRPGVEPALSATVDDVETAAVIANVRHNVERLRHTAPIIDGLVREGKVAIVGGVYDLATGRVDFL